MAGKKRKMTENEQNSGKRQKLSIRHRGIPAELLNELFGSLPLNNAFDLLAKMSNGLLARNIQKIIKSIKMVMKANKWNEADCGPQLDISQEGMVVKSFSIQPDCNFVRANLPIPELNLSKPAIRFYFEVQILNRIFRYCSISVGFCCQNFPLENSRTLENRRLGRFMKSIGINRKDGMWIGSHWKGFENAQGWFKQSDVIGIGIVSRPTSKMECFATWNGELLGKIELPSKFAKVQLFPAVSFSRSDELIRANFGKEKWRFKEFNKIVL